MGDHVPLRRRDRRCGAAATRAAVGLVLAGVLACAAHAQIAFAHSYTNHQPLRGNYPGSYPDSPAAPTLPPLDSFDWVAAGAGAGAMLGVVLLLSALKAGLRAARRDRADDAPLVFVVRDNRPA